MKITKYAHACLLIEVDGVRIVTDPGSWNETPDATEVDAILITHEHQDHCSLDQVKSILERNHGAIVITHPAVGKLLEEQGIPYTSIGEGERIMVKTASVESFGHDHASIYGGVIPCRNTGYRIAERLFVPGDALSVVPDLPIEILALPTGGPWLKLSETIEYAKKLSPKAVFPIHDAMYIEGYTRELVPRIVGGNLKEAGIEFRDMGPGSVEEF